MTRHKKTADLGSQDSAIAATSNGDKGGDQATQDRETARAGIKQARIIALLSRPEGASLDDLIAATGWLPHTTRAALTGLRKKWFAIRRDEDGERRSLYRIGAADSPTDEGGHPAEEGQQGAPVPRGAHQPTAGEG